MSAAIKRWECDAKLSDMVQHGDRLYLAGQVAEQLAAGTREQAAEILGLIDKLLARGGSDKTRLLSAVVFLADMRTKPDLDAAWLAWADPQCVPARAVLEARLGSPDTRVEIVCVAGL